MTVTWFDGATLTIEAALSSATDTYATWDVGEWDTATWGPDIVWTDISEYVRHISTQARFARDVQAWDTSTATIELLNQDGRFSPANLSGPYVAAGVTGIRPWRPIRIRAGWGGHEYPLWAGYALAWTESFTPGDASVAVAITTVSCVDEFGSLARFDGLEQSPMGGGEPSGKRLHRILDNAGHTGTRQIDVGRVTLQPTTLAQNAVSDIKLVADSEGGAAWVGPDGTVMFEHQYALLENYRSRVAQAEFGDGPSELPCTEIEVAYDGDLLVNIAAFARAGGTAQVASDSTSRSLYGDSRYSRTDLLCETDSQVQGLVNFYLDRYKEPEQRVTAMTVNPRANPSLLFPEVLGRLVRDRITVKKRPPGGHTIDRDVFIAGVSHDIGLDTWTTTFDLWSATPYSAFTFSLWDEALWDTAVWFH